MGPRLHTFEELPLQSQLRVLHEGKWVAWSDDGAKIVASAEHLLDMDRAVQQAGVIDAVYEWVEPIAVRWTSQ